MARIRSINPCQPKDEDVATLSIHARYVFAFLPCHADREGRLKDSAFTLKAEILPGDAADMEAILAELAAGGFIIRYVVEGRRFIQIRTFLRHQSPHTREVPSMIPPAPGKAMPEHRQGDASTRGKPGEGEAKASPGLEGMSSSPSIPDQGSGSGDQSLPSLRSDQVQTRPRSEGRAGFGAPHQPARLVPVALFTVPFLDVFDRYPRKDAKQAAAVVFHEIAADFPGGEGALSKAILAAFDAGMLQRHPYHGRNATRPMLDRLLAERRWEDPPSAPDDAEAPREPFAVQSERRREEAVTDAKLERIREELKPRTPRLSPREEYLRKTGGAA